ncbi:hypothetical protein EOD39_7264 [Acipenser ruthenus]|uniref:Uncharacterized protein n=1 Tax=Acipenser ruthenus TaxID=7906 RepID=A0A444U7I6_ACIRT|nr:hypothetical protein EOD39_7264 [Acipenser ruthenus]
MQKVLSKEIKKKWSDLKTQVTEDFPKTLNFPTGGGSKPNIGPQSEIVLEILGEDSAAVIGVTGGVLESGMQGQPGNDNTNSNSRYLSGRRGRAAVSASGSH